MNADLLCFLFGCDDITLSERYYTSRRSRIYTSHNIMYIVLRFDPSNTASPLDTFKFYSHPSVSALSSQASLASYSPEDAFSNFGAQFRQGYLVEGSPSLTPVPKTILQSSQTPISISSKDHPLHGQVFKYSQSFVPYPALVTGSDNAPAFRSLPVPSSTVTAESAAAAVSSTTEAAAQSDSASTTVAA